MDIQATLEYFKSILNTKSMDEITRTFYKNAVESLQKQVPRKPIQQKNWKACPSCEQGIGITNKTLNPRAVEYCFHCGQRLNWKFCPKCGGDLILLDNGNYPEYYEEWLECEKCGFACDIH